MTEERFDVAVDPDGAVRIMRALYNGATLEAVATPVFVLSYRDALGFAGRFAEAVRKAAPLNAAVREAERLRRQADDLDQRRINGARPVLIEAHDPPPAPPS